MRMWINRFFLYISLTQQQKKWDDEGNKCSIWEKRARLRNFTSFHMKMGRLILSRKHKPLRGILFYFLCLYWTWLFTDDVFSIIWIHINGGWFFINQLDNSWYLLSWVLLGMNFSWFVGKFMLRGTSLQHPLELT